jgi:hypothetical protein
MTVRTGVLLSAASLRGAKGGNVSLHLHPRKGFREGDHVRVGRWPDFRRRVHAASHASRSRRERSFSAKLVST